MTPKLVRLAALKHHWTIYYFLLPALALIVLFQYIPVGLAVFHSFFRWNGQDVNEYVGMQNYRELMTREDFWASFRVALIIGVWNIVKMIPAIAVAICISRVYSARKQFFYRIMFVAPMVLPALVLALVWRTFFFDATMGYLNRGLISTGLYHVLIWFQNFLGLGDVFKPNELPSWLGDEKLILFACIAWGFPWVGSFAVLTHLAKLQGIPKELHEAAELDGASWWSKMTRLELPMLSGSIYILVVFILIDTVKDTTMIFAVAGIEGGPGGVVTVPGLFIFREAFVNQAMGATCAVAVVLALIVMGIKKLLDMTGKWEELRPWQRAALPALGAVAAWIFCVYLESPFLATVMGAVVIPWRGVETALRCLASPRTTVLEPRKPIRDEDRLGLGAVYAATAGAIVLMNRLAPFSPYCSLLALAAVLPWLRIAWSIREARLRSRPAKVSDPWATTPQQLLARERLAKKMDSPSYERRRRGAAGTLLFGKHAIIWLTLVTAYLPLLVMLIVSFKSNQQYYFYPATPTFPLHGENWSHAWRLIAPSLANSVFVTIASTALTLLVALGAAYFFARVQVPGSKFLWNALVPLMVIPTIAYLVPLFGWLKEMSLLNTLSALIAVGAAGGQIFAIFVLRNFIADIPQDLFEAAEIDGASHFRQMFTIVAPLSAPILGVVGLMHAVGQWNEFMMPLVVMSDNDKLPVMVQLLRMNGEYIKEFGPLMAGYALASVPVIVLFIACMRLFTRGLTEGAVKA